jgi:hypothetical protein
MKKSAGIFLTLLIIISSVLTAFADPLPRKYTSFSGKGSDFYLIPGSKMQYEGTYKSDYQYAKDVLVRVSVKRQQITGDTTKALLAMIAPNPKYNDQQAAQWVNLDYNHFQIRGVSCNQPGESKIKESFFLLGNEGVVVVFDFSELKGSKLGIDEFRSRRNMFLAQYTNYIK